MLYIADEFKTSEGVALGVVMLASTPGVSTAVGAQCIERMFNECLTTFT